LEAFLFRVWNSDKVDDMGKESANDLNHRYAEGDTLLMGLLRTLISPLQRLMVNECLVTARPPINAIDRHIEEQWFYKSIQWVSRMLKSDVVRHDFSGLMLTGSGAVCTLAPLERRQTCKLCRRILIGDPSVCECWKPEKVLEFMPRTTPLVFLQHIQKWYQEQNGRSYFLTESDRLNRLSLIEELIREMVHVMWLCSNYFAELRPAVFAALPPYIHVVPLREIVCSFL
jgi:hypothetical protein